MSEEIVSNFGRDEGEGLGESDVKSSHRPLHELAQTLFEDRPAGLDRVEVRGIGWEVSYLGTGGFNQFFQPFYFVLCGRKDCPSPRSARSAMSGRALL